jgi:predicted glycosyltransferase
MTLIWLDVLTPKQALFCQKVAEQFQTANFDIVFTTRDYQQVVGKLDLLGIKAKIIGKHGGADPYEKLLASAERVVALTKYINKINPDLAFGFASPESARVAFGLGIPYYSGNDSPHSHFVAQLTIPYAIKLFTPWIMEKAWYQLDVPPQKIITYHALDPIAWLQDFKPNTTILRELGLEPGKDYVIIRPEEAQASYLYGVADELSPVTNPVIHQIIQSFPDLPIVVLSRYREQREVMRKQFGNKIILPENVVDATSLLALSSLFVGAGGTMNQEASILGIPVISCYPGREILTEQFLREKKLLYRFSDTEEAARKAVSILKREDHYRKLHRERAQKLRAEMENPVDVIRNYILAHYPETKKPN